MAKISIIPWIVKKLKRCIGIVEDTDTASQAIASNKYIIWKGDVCKSTSAISEGDTLSSSNLSAVNDGVGNDLSQAIANIINTLQFKRMQSETDKTTHIINVPNDTMHFLIFGATSYSYHGYGMVAATSGGALNAPTIQLEGITITTGTGTITCNVGSSARPFYLIDILVRGNGYCTLS